jgi:endonuclease YncB( thermonuclease family)
MGFLFSKFGMYLGLVVVGLIALAVIARNWSCRKSPEPNTIERTSGPFAVVSVDSGASLTYKHNRRNTSLSLPNIAAPAEGQKYFDESKASLESMLGRYAAIKIHETKDRRLDRFTADDVFGPTGQCLQIEQLKAGWAWCLVKAPKAYQEAQSQAAKAKRGIWKDWTGWRINTDTGEATPLYKGDGPKPLTDDEFEKLKNELRFGQWIEEHVKACKECTYDRTSGHFECSCSEAIAKLKELHLYHEKEK